MEKTLLVLFLFLIASVPFVYRYIRIGKLGWFVKTTSHLSIDKNYNIAEKFRVVQVVLGSIFLFITIIISLLAEIIGSKTGYIFGGKYQYNKDNTPGYIVYGVPLLIPIAWFGIIYMCMNFCYYITNINFPFESSFNHYFIILTAILVVFLDFVLDPIAVDEKRWEWDSPGIYYGVPILNFFGWLIVPVVVLFLFEQLFQPVIISIFSYSSLFQYAPGLLFIFLPIIASRPCFERGLVIPGYIGVITSFLYFFIVINKY